MISMGLVDDHPTYLYGLQTALSVIPDVHVAWACTTIEEALRNLGRTPVQVVVMDIQYGRSMAGLDAIMTIRRSWPKVSVVAMSALADPAVIERATRGGAAAFVSKHLSIPEMLDKVQQALQAQRMPGRSTRPASKGRAGGPESKTLSRRELEVLEGIRKGQTNRDIAAVLGISTTTVNKHVKSLLRKLNARNRAQAAGMS